jgi:hypothetical protein
MQLFKDESSHAKVNAQHNLCGRTHYVDDDTLRWHKSHIISARVVDRGLLFAIVTSDALDMNNTKRGFRYVIFDVFGSVLGRPELKEAYRTSALATKAMWTALNKIDAKAHTLAAIENARQQYTKELEWLTQSVNALELAAA